MYINNINDDDDNDVMTDIEHDDCSKIVVYGASDDYLASVDWPLNQQQLGREH